MREYIKRATVRFTRFEVRDRAGPPLQRFTVSFGSHASREFNGSHGSQVPAVRCYGSDGGVPAVRAVQHAAGRALGHRADFPAAVPVDLRRDEYKGARSLGGALSGNQNLRRVRAESPSTRRLLDGVVVLVPHRSTEPAWPRHRREMT